ncbi:Imm74 family immunity protein [Paenibacillus herberti]|uniref:Immunity protein 74 n=1 Tax=Paenibacillus herberti TaxID=1619309 RepID=A0A229P0C9_9BACL|nr:Imm74 family immunity protein [Paenibacillus herberti]OXM15557.1 hypothetical protein CGZ75_02120 [Paenibacillus herberti]
MKITGTMSYIKVEIDDKIVKINGEMIVGGFVAFKKSIGNWESPFESESIDENMKEQIIRDVVNQTKDSHMVITFE